MSVGVVGAGQISRVGHVPVLAAMDEVSLAWITDRDPDRAKELADGFGTRYAPLPDDLTKLPDADIILLALPYGVRESYYEALSSREVALLVEKPLFRSVDEHRRLCAAFPAHRFGQSFSRRSMGSTQLVKRLIEQRCFGSLQRLEVGFGSPGAKAGNYQSDLRMAGGGMLFDSAIHPLDLIFYLTSTRTQQVEDVRMVMDMGFDLHTEVDLLVETPEGDSVRCALTVSCLEDTSNRLDLHFEHAVVSYSAYDLTGGVSLRPLEGGDTYSLRPESGPFVTKHFQILYEHWRNFVIGVRSECPNYTSAHDTFQTTQLVEHCYQIGEQAQPQTGIGA